MADLKKKLAETEKQHSEALAAANARMQEMNRNHANEIKQKAAQVAALESVMVRLHAQAAKAVSESKKATQSQTQAQKKPTPKQAAQQQKRPAPKPPQIAPIYYEKAHAVNFEDRDRAVNQIRSALRKFPKARVILTGHADDSQYPQANLEVSHNRARFLAAYLQQVSGISMDRIKTQAHGDKKPAKGNPNANRRVDIVIQL
jgi:outer membrane protein OmpA-like peptidoglycan-associated protein